MRKIEIGSITPALLISTSTLQRPQAAVHSRDNLAERATLQDGDGLLCRFP